MNQAPRLSEITAAKMLAARGHPRDAIYRAVVAVLRAQFDQSNSGAEAHFERVFGRDETGRAILKAATSPASVSSSAWAGILATPTVAGFVANIGPMSAASELIRRGLIMTFENGVVTIPGVLGVASGSGFVEEGAPIPVEQSAVTALSLSPKKLAVISTFTRELAEHSQIEKLVRAVLAQNTALALDSVFFGTAAASNAAPAGIRNGICRIDAKHRCCWRGRDAR
jgi:HK97 family phage major capsid protein